MVQRTDRNNVQEVEEAVVDVEVDRTHIEL